MDWGFSWLLAFIDSFWSVIVQVVMWFVDGIGYIIKFTCYNVLEGFYTILLSMIQAIDISTIMTNLTMSWGLLPGALGYLLVAVNIPQGLGIIGAAYLIRLGLNLIPSVFTRI